MGFTIDYGTPGLLMAALIVIGVGAAGIVAYFLLSVVKSAREDALEEDEPED